MAKSQRPIGMDKLSSVGVVVFTWWCFCARGVPSTRARFLGFLNQFGVGLVSLIAKKLLKIKMKTHP